MQNRFDISEREFRLRFNRARFDFARDGIARQLPRHKNQAVMHNG